jgi:hypothetical protein
MGSRCITPCILNLGTRCRWTVTFTARCPLNEQRAWREMVWMRGENENLFLLSENDPEFCGHPAPYLSPCIHWVPRFPSSSTALALSSDSSQDKWRGVINVARCTRRASVLQALWSQRTVMSNELTVNTSYTLCHQRGLQWNASLPFNFTEVHFAKTVTTNVKSDWTLG